MKIYLTIMVTLLFIYSGFSQPKNLDECVKLALVNNPELLKSEYSLQQSQLSTKQAWSSLYPGVSASASVSNSGPVVSDMANVWDQSISASVSQQIYQPGMYTGISLAKARQASLLYSDASLEDQVRSFVERLYFQILAADTLIGVYKANIRLSDEQITKMQMMVDLGLKRPSDLLKSQVQRGTFESQLIREIESLASSKRALNSMMGLKPNTTLEILPVDVETISVPVYTVGLEMMINNNPNIKRLDTQIKIQILSLRTTKEAYLPSLSGSYSASQRNNVLGGPAINSDQISLRMSISLFDGFSKSVNVQKSQLNLDEAQLDYDVLLRDMDESLSNQYKSLDTQNRLIEIHKTNLASARKDLEVVTEQYANGFSSILDLTDSQVSVLQSETSLLQDLYTRKQIESEIKRLIGN